MIRCDNNSMRISDSLYGRNFGHSESTAGLGFFVCLFRFSILCVCVPFLLGLEEWLRNDLF